MVTPETITTTIRDIHPTIRTRTVVTTVMEVAATITADARAHRSNNRRLNITTAPGDAEVRTTLHQIQVTTAADLHHLTATTAEAIPAIRIAGIMEAVEIVAAARDPLEATVVTRRPTVDLRVHIVAVVPAHTAQAHHQVLIPAAEATNT